MKDSDFRLEKLPFAHTRITRKTAKILLNKACGLASMVMHQMPAEPQAEIPEIINYCVRFSLGTEIEYDYDIDHMKNLALACRTVASHRAGKPRREFNSRTDIEWRQISRASKKIQEAWKDKIDEEERSIEWDYWRTDHIFSIIISLLKITSYIARDQLENACDEFKLGIMDQVPVTLLRLDYPDTLPREEEIRLLEEYRDRIWRKLY